jgi:hypothetical protein
MLYHLGTFPRPPKLVLIKEVNTPLPKRRRRWMRNWRKQEEGLGRATSLYIMFLLHFLLKLGCHR